MMARDFERLLFRAEIDRYGRELWFGDCTLEKSVILCPDGKTRDTLERLYGSTLRKIQSDITFRVQALQTVTTALQKRRWRIGDPKPRTGAHDVTGFVLSRKPDLLDSED